MGGRRATVYVATTLLASACHGNTLGLRGFDRARDPAPTSTEWESDSSSTSAPVRLTAAQIGERADPSVVVVITPDGLGTGFVVGKGVVATNLHVVAGESSVELVSHEGARLPVSRVVAWDAAHDIALLYSTPAESLSRLRLGNSASVTQGDPIVAIGTPELHGWTLSTGVISARRHERLQITAPISHGSSGGPLFDESGAVVGVTYAADERGQNLNFAVPIEYVQALMRQPAPVAMDDFATATKPAAAQQAPETVAFPASVAGFSFGATVKESQRVCAAARGRAVSTPQTMTCSTVPVDPFGTTAGAVLEFCTADGVPGVCSIRPTFSENSRRVADSIRAQLTSKYGPMTDAASDRPCPTQAAVTPLSGIWSWRVVGAAETVSGGSVSLDYGCGPKDDGPTVSLVYRSPRGVLKAIEERAKIKANF